MKEMKQFEIKIIFSVIIIVILMQLSSCKVQDTMMVPAGTYLETGQYVPEKYIEKGHWKGLYWISDEKPRVFSRAKCLEYEQ
tara:strand:+ start:256 stop:501 length:246 start_codon:yes stop_codon:yes gene_type:complete